VEATGPGEKPRENDVAMPPALPGGRSIVVEHRTNSSRRRFSDPTIAPHAVDAAGIVQTSPSASAPTEVVSRLVVDYFIANLLCHEGYICYRRVTIDSSW
jgi:hypothetical protein